MQPLYSFPSDSQFSYLIFKRKRLFCFHCQRSMTIIIIVYKCMHWNARYSYSSNELIIRKTKNWNKNICIQCLCSFQINWYKPDTVLPVQYSISILQFYLSKCAEGLTALQSDDALFLYFTTFWIYLYVYLSVEC